jgi:hypothetical protein
MAKGHTHYYGLVQGPHVEEQQVAHLTAYIIAEFLLYIHNLQIWPQAT